MYLISLYFDEETNKKIQLYMELIAQRTGNMAMIDGKVPPHITLSAFDMAEEEKAIAGFTAMEQEFEKGQIFWCSVGMFLPHTIYLSPVLNAYLQKLSESVFSKIRYLEFPNGGASIFTFEIKGGVKEAHKFIDNLKIFSLLANVADVKSLVIHPATTTHSQLTEEELLDQGIKPNTIRLSIGTEHIDDILADLQRGFDAVKEE